MKETTTPEDEQFRLLSEQHARLDTQIQQIESKPHVTEADEMEEQGLKKLKLQAKDLMNELLAQSRSNSVR